MNYYSEETVNKVLESEWERLSYPVTRADITKGAKPDITEEELNKIQDSLCDVSQLISGWKSTTPVNEWSEFDESCINKLHASQIIIDNYLKTKTK